MSIFICTGCNDFGVSSDAQKKYFFNCADESNYITPGWGGAVASIEDCGSSDSGAIPDLDLCSYQKEVF